MSLVRVSKQQTRFVGGERHLSQAVNRYHVQLCTQYIKRNRNTRRRGNRRVAERMALGVDLPSLRDLLTDIKRFSKYLQSSPSSEGDVILLAAGGGEASHPQWA